MNTKDNNLDALDRATAWLERTEDLTLEDLRSVRRQMGDDVEGSEREFLKFITEVKAVIDTTTKTFGVKLHGAIIKEFLKT